MSDAGSIDHSTYTHKNGVRQILFGEFLPPIILNSSCWMQWHIFVVLALRRLRQEDETNLRPAWIIKQDHVSKNVREMIDRPIEGET